MVSYAKRHSETIDYICKTRIHFEYRYGTHADYILCDENDSPCPLVVGDYYLVSFSTTGTKNDYMLIWTLRRDNEEVTYTLHRYGAHPDCDEWDNEFIETSRLIRDIRSIGLDKRIEIDNKRRVIYDLNEKLEEESDRDRLFHSIDFSRSGITARSMAVNLPTITNKSDIRFHLDESYDSAKIAISFLDDEIAKRHTIIQQYSESNAYFKEKVLNIETLYLSDGTTTIRKGQFDYCDKIKCIILPPSVKELYEQAINRLSPSVKLMLTPHRIVSLLSYPGTDQATLSVFVPQHLEKEYKTSLVWKRYTNQIFAL